MISLTTFIGITIACILFSTILLVVYIGKKRLITLETKIYTALLTSNFIGLILELGCHFGVIYINDNNQFIFMTIMKFYVAYILIWTLIFNVYVLVTSANRKELPNFNLSDYSKKIVKLTVIVALVLTIIILLLPLEIFYNGISAYTNGPGVDLIIMPISFTCLVVWTITCILNFRKLRQKKFLPILLCIFLLTIVAIVQSIDRSILIITTAHTIVTTLMFHTIENPDLKLIEELNFAKEQAERANAAKTDFLSNMSHEIRTPLNAIVGFSQALLTDSIKEESKEEVKDIIMASEALLEIVNGILDISKIEANKLEITSKEYSFKRSIEDVIALTRSRLNEKAIDFRINIDQSIPEALYGDYFRLKQIMLNLLTNAIKYTKKGYIELKISSINKGNTCRLIISIEDSGIGIKKDSIDKLFTKFERMGVENEITIEGTGLGLAITKKLIDLMNGQIVVQSVYGKGSRFTVAIDQGIIEATPEKLKELNNDIENTMTLNLENINLADKRILVVDDNTINLKVASRLLKDFHMHVDQVTSGKECLELIESGNIYDLILLDDMMPKLTGTETLKMLKANSNFKTPVIALTANSIAGMREKYLDEGFDDYLSKPVRRNELNKIIKQFLDK